MSGSSLTLAGPLCEMFEVQDLIGSDVDRPASRFGVLIGRASIEPRAFMSTPNGADAQAAAQAASAQVAKAHLPRRLGIAAPPPGGPQPVGPAGGPGDGTLRPEEALLNSSPYLKSMALLDGLDLQQLMSGGDLAVARSRGVEGKGRFRPVRAVRRSGKRHRSTCARLNNSRRKLRDPTTLGRRSGARNAPTTTT